MQSRFSHADPTNSVHAHTVIFFIPEGTLSAFPCQQDEAATELEKGPYSLWQGTKPALSRALPTTGITSQINHRRLPKAKLANEEYVNCQWARQSAPWSGQVIRMSLCLHVGVSIHSCKCTHASRSPKRRDGHRQTEADVQITGEKAAVGILVISPICSATLRLHVRVWAVFNFPDLTRSGDASGFRGSAHCWTSRGRGCCGHGVPRRKRRFNQ